MVSCQVHLGVLILSIRELSEGSLYEWIHFEWV